MIDLERQLREFGDAHERTWGPISPEDITHRAGPSNLFQRRGNLLQRQAFALLIAAATAVLVGLPILLLGRGTPPGSGSLGTLPVPALGETEPEFLDDGHPVFVVHDLDGSVYVIDAISTHIRLDQMAWCPSSRTIDDVFHGSRWDARGRYLHGPGPTDLGSYTFEMTGGGRRVMVMDYVEPQPRSEVSDGMAGPPCVDGGYQIHPFHANVPELWPSEDATEKFIDYVTPIPETLLEQAGEAEWHLLAVQMGLDHCASLLLGGPSRHSAEYLDEKDAAYIATGEPPDGRAGPAQSVILYEMVADEAAELILCPALVDG